MTGEAIFPIRLTLKRPNAAELRDRFDEARRWSASLRSMRHVRITIREFRHRVSGANALPQEAWIDTLEDAAALIGKRSEVATFRRLVETTRSRQPSLLPWIARRPLKALALADDWARLLDVVDWLQAHPRPGVSLRQSAPGTDSRVSAGLTGSRDVDSSTGAISTPTASPSSTSCVVISATSSRS